MNADGSLVQQLTKIRKRIKNKNKWRLYL